MTPEMEADIDRCAKAAPFPTLELYVVLLVRAATRGALYLCVGFGAAEVTGYGWWMAPLVAFALAMTVGRVWAKHRAPKMAALFKKLADDAEKMNPPKEKP